MASALNSAGIRMRLMPEADELIESPRQALEIDGIPTGAHVVRLQHGKPAAIGTCPTLNCSGGLLVRVELGPAEWECRLCGERGDAVHYVWMGPDLGETTFALMNSVADA